MISRVLNVLSLDPGEINPRFVEHSDPLRNYQSYVGYLLTGSGGNLFYTKVKKSTYLNSILRLLSLKMVINKGRGEVDLLQLASPIINVNFWCRDFFANLS